MGHNVEANTGQDLVEQRHASHTIGVEVAIDTDTLAAIARLADTLHSPIHIAELAGMMQLTDMHVEESVDLVRIGLTACPEQLSDQRMDIGWKLAQERPRR